MIEFFFRISIAFALVMVVIFPVLPCRLPAVFLILCAILTALALDGRCNFSAVKTSTQKLE
jgi:hypothetical protein